MMTFLLALAFLAQDAERTRLKLGLFGGEIVHGLQESASTFCARAVFEASRLNEGNLTTTGTLRQEDEGYSYAEEPADRLKVVLADGTSEFTITKMDGNLSLDANRYLLKAHDFRYRWKAKGVDLKVKSVRTGAGAVEATIAGTFEYEKQRLKIDAKEKGTYAYSDNAEVWIKGDGWGVSPKGYVLKVERDVTGSISGEEFSLELEESMIYKSIYFQNFVENHTRTSKSRWTSGRHKFALEEFRIRTAFLDTDPSEFDFWKVEGRLLRDGKAVGAMSWSIGSSRRAEPTRIFLVMGDEEIPLEEWKHKP